MDIDAGSLVYAIAGRDKDGLFMVLKRDGAYVYIADGKSRKSESPKKKKIKHTRLVGTASEDIKNLLLEGESLTNAVIRRSLSEFAEEQTEG